MALIPCPECKTEISESAVSCPKCGFPIAARKEKTETAPLAARKEKPVTAPPVPPSVPSFDPARERICPGCKAVIANDFWTCPKCGYAFPVAGKTPAAGFVTPGPWRAQSFFDNFLGILSEPRKTFGYILLGPHFEGTWSMLLLLSLLQFVKGVQEGHFIIGLILIPLGVGLGYLALWVGSRINYHVGRWFGGKGSRDDLFDYGIWASAASAVGSMTTIIKNFGPSPLWQTLWKVVGWGVALWALAIAIVLLSTAHRFSIGRAILVQVTILTAFFGLLAIVLLACGISLSQILLDVITK